MCAFAALAVVLCTSLMLSAPSVAADAGMYAIGMPAQAATGLVDLAGSDGAMSLRCEGTCATDGTVACAAAGVATVGLLMLVGPRRTRHSVLAPRESLGRPLRTAGVEQPPWSVLSPTKLCVMRV